MNERQAGGENRTRIHWVEARRSTIELHPQKGNEDRGRRWSGRRDSNPRPSRWQRGALPAELLPRKGAHERGIRGARPRVPEPIGDGITVVQPSNEATTRDTEGLRSIDTHARLQPRAALVLVCSPLHLEGEASAAERRASPRLAPDGYAAGRGTRPSGPPGSGAPHTGRGARDGGGGGSGGSTDAGGDGGHLQFLVSWVYGTTQGVSSEACEQKPRCRPAHRARSWARPWARPRIIASRS